MREQIKQKLREMVVTLGRAEALLDSRSKMRDEEAVTRMLGEMQYTAIAMGTAIEDEEGQETETVRHLEDYCELLWQYMTADILTERFRVGRALAGKRSEISASLEREIEGRLGVVFLLCKAKRWRQMEPLWAIAGCGSAYDCEVLVSACGERLKDGRFGQFHDESGMIPECVGAVEYDAFDLEAWEPDLVFIEGPYAGDGASGSVPGYDFEEVRAHAGALIYLPVYDDEKQVKEADCMLPQISRADLIIVQSEAVKEAYAGILNKTQEGRAAAEKIQVLTADGKAGILNQLVHNSARDRL